MRKFLLNAYVPLLPILVWNLLLTDRLPQILHPALFNQAIPLFIVIGENIFRSIIFTMPLAMQNDYRNKAGRAGVKLYLFGSLLYYASWLILIFFPQAHWSHSLFGLAAPAYTPFVWLVGIAYMANSYYFPLPYKRWHYFLPALAFSGFHLAHAYIVYARNTP
jgi:hypothetical protein